MSHTGDMLTNILGYTNPESKEEQFGKQIGIHGPKRKGKTLTLLMCILYFLENFDFIKGVICNINLNLPKPFNDMYVPLKDIKMISFNEYRKYLIAVDELGHVIESRMSSSFRNLFVTNILADTGKFEQFLLYTSQHASQIDKRVRGNVDVIFRPMIDFNSGLMQTKVVPDYRTYFMLDALQEWELYDLEFYFPFRQFYDWYDTKEKVEEYVITFEPEDYFVMFQKWYGERGYDKQDDIKITKGTLNYWKENQGVVINNSQISALMEYMLRETDLPMYMRGRK